MLEALARGLRAAGGVLSPNVSQQLAQEGLQDQVAERQMAMQMLQQRIADQREQALAGAVAPALQSGDFEAAARAAASSGAPGGTAMAMNLLGQVDARKARAEQVQMNLNMKAMELRQKHMDKMEELRQRGADAASMNEARIAAQREIAEFNANARREMAQFMASLRQPPQPQMVTTPEGVFQVGRDGKASQVVGPDGKPLTGRAPEKALPTSAGTALLTNQQNLRRAEQALALLEGKPVGSMQGDQNATGWKGFLPDAVLQRVDPSGTDARAAIADLGSLVIHDRSGAAVTAAEFPRLQPFIPSPKDDPETARKKLKRFVQVYKEVTDDAKTFYKESGYKVPELPSSQQTAPTGPKQIKSDAEYDALPSGAEFIGPDGKKRRKP